MSYLILNSRSCKECGSNKLYLLTGRIQERSKWDASPYVLLTSQNPPCWNPSWLSEAHTIREYPESECLASDNPETKPVTIRPKTASHVAGQVPRVPLPCCSPPRHPFPVKSLALSACVSSQTIHFWVLDKCPSQALEGVPLPTTRRLTKKSKNLEYTTQLKVERAFFITEC